VKVEVKHEREEEEIKTLTSSLALLAYLCVVRVKGEGRAPVKK
jgi:hypothetical protein